MIETDHVTIRALSGPEARVAVGMLADLLIDCVEGGASISFMWPLDRGKAVCFWEGVADGVTSGDRMLLVAEKDGSILGTVQVILKLPENQPHRAEVAKMLVRRTARRQGLAARLMQAAERTACEVGKSLLVLDTVTGSIAEHLYLRLGWQPVGVVPNFALMPDGRLCDATIFYKVIAPFPA